MRRRYLNPELVRALAIDIANATFGARRQSIWGTGSTTVASDSTHFGLVHPTYQAMLEVGRAQRSIFVARYLRSGPVQPGWRG